MIRDFFREINVLWAPNHNFQHLRSYFFVTHTPIPSALSPEFLLTWPHSLWSEQSYFHFSWCQKPFSWSTFGKYKYLTCEILQYLGCLGHSVSTLPQTDIERELSDANCPCGFTFLNWPYTMTENRKQQPVIKLLLHFYLTIYLTVCVHMHVCTCVHIPQNTSESQNLSCGENLFSPTTMLILVMELRYSLGSLHLYTLLANLQALINIFKISFNS